MNDIVSSSYKNESLCDIYSYCVYFPCTGNVPIPILFGFLFDINCTVWQERCEETGACWLYDTRGLAITLVLAGLGAKGISALLYLIAILIYKPNKDDEGGDKDKDESDSQGTAASLEERRDAATTSGADDDVVEFTINGGAIRPDGKTDSGVGLDSLESSTVPGNDGAISPHLDDKTVADFFHVGTMGENGVAINNESGFRSSLRNSAHSINLSTRL